MRGVKYLEIDEVMAIHEEMINRFGGRMPVLDFTMLHSAISRPKATFGDEDLYPTIFDKAAALIQSLILNHPFDDGNKRTSITSCALFLHRNGLYLSLPQKESIQFTLAIDSKKVDFGGIAQWLKKYSRS
jgi:death on curing protein